MSETFKAILVSRDADKKQSVEIVDLGEADLMEGDVTVAVEATTVNYKDGLAITGKAPVIRRWPLVPGIDFAGTVISSSHTDWRKGDKVILNGWGVGETHFGAYAGRARVKGDWLVPLPDGISAHDAMAVGTAGYTAMLCVMALERHGILPDRGPVVVTGAAGGVGSVAVSLLSSLGYHVIDYILFHTPVWSFAVFNLADAFISVGAALIVFDEFIGWRREAKPESPDA